MIVGRRRHRAYARRAATASRTTSRLRFAAVMFMTASTSGLLVGQNAAMWMMSPSRTRASKRSGTRPSACAFAISATLSRVLLTA